MTLLFVGCAILTIGLSAPGFGRVFLRRRAGSPEDRLLTSREWQILLRSGVRINDGRGSLEVIGCDEDLPSVMRRIRRVYAESGLLAEFGYNESMGRALVKAGDRVSQIIALDAGPLARSVVFVLTQSHDDYLLSLSAPRAHSLRGVPAYPGSIAGTFVQLEETRAQLEISSSPAGPEAVRAFYQSALTLDGWRKLTPQTGASSGPSGVALFQKGFELCAVFAQPSGGETVITVLHKRLRMP